MLFLLLVAQLAVASIPGDARAPRANAPSLETAAPNDNRRAAGRLENGVLTIALEARETAWYPETDKGPGIRVYTFAEIGSAATVPGPLIRVPAGTRIRGTIRNALAKPMMMRGLHDHAGALDSVDIAPGASHEFDFTVSVPGTFIYWGRTQGSRLRLGGGEDGSLQGAFIVDPAGVTPPATERVMMIQLWLGQQTLADSAGAAPRRLETITVNGLSWPHTERHTYTVGDSVHWRVINASIAPHPMHLHGFYFTVDARGTPISDTLYSPASRRLAVTEFMAPATTMRMTWIPSRAGNWLFHCHLIAHVDVNHVRLGKPPGGHASHGGSAATTLNHAESGMAGLVTGIHVRPRPGAARVREPATRRRLRAFVNTRQNVFGDRPAYSMILQQGNREPARDSITLPGSALVLRRGEPTEIVVRNRTLDQVTIHWHGIELESYYDGVGDWSGAGKRLAPAIAPGDSFIVRMTPDRAGTFIYHTHMEEGGQLASGLYGALLVLPPGVAADTAHDRIFLLGAGGPVDTATHFVNGTASPPPVELDANVPYRLRFINISPSNIKRVRLLAASDTTVQSWRAFAKDGAELPAHQATDRRATVLLGPGETYDFELMRPEPASLMLEITTNIRGMPPARVPVNVR